MSDASLPPFSSAGLCRANLSFFRNELATSLQSSQPFEPTSELVNLLDEDIETLDNVTETALLIERIANDFLSLGKIQLATLEIFATPCDLSAEVRKLLGVFASEARLKGTSSCVPSDGLVRRAEHSSSCLTLVRYPHRTRPQGPTGRPQWPAHLPHRPCSSRSSRHQPPLERHPFHKRFREARDLGRP